MATKNAVKEKLVDGLEQHGITGEEAGNIANDQIDLLGEEIEFEDEDEDEEED